jgi:solute carrier family 7 (L-type amino acid transporter), member 9/15
LNYVTEELKNPFVNLPRSIMIGIPLVAICYLALNISYLTALSKDDIINSDAVAVASSFLLSILLSHPGSQD